MRRWLLGGFLAVGLGSPPCSLAQESRQFIQAELLKTIQARKAKVGDVVNARAVQALIVRGGPTIPEGTVLLGKVRTAGGNFLAISFDEVKLSHRTTPLKLSIRAAMMPDGPQAARDMGSSPPEDSSSPRRAIPSGDFDHRPASAASRQPAATGTAASEASQSGRNVAGQTGSVIGMPGVTLQVDEGPEHASRFAAEKELQLKGGLQFMLAVAEN